MRRRGRFSERFKARKRRWKAHRRQLPTFVLEVDKPLTPEEQAGVDHYHDLIRSFGFGAAIVVAESKGNENE